jgi:hypothetical protein
MAIGRGFYLDEYSNILKLQSFFARGINDIHYWLAPMLLFLGFALAYMLEILYLFLPILLCISIGYGWYLDTFATTLQTINITATKEKEITKTKKTIKLSSPPLLPPPLTKIVKIKEKDMTKTITEKLGSATNAN